MINIPPLTELFNQKQLQKARRAYNESKRNNKRMPVLLDDPNMTESRRYWAQSNKNERMYYLISLAKSATCGDFGGWWHMQKVNEKLVKEEWALVDGRLVQKTLDGEGWELVPYQFTMPFEMLPTPRENTPLHDNECQYPDLLNELYMELDMKCTVSAPEEGDSMTEGNGNLGERR